MKQNNKLSTNFVDNLVKNSQLKGWGIAKPDLPLVWKKWFKKWLQQEHYAEMDWITRGVEQRLNIKQRFPWCKSVLVVADNYYSSNSFKPRAPYISKYSWGENYHQIVSQKLESLLANIKRKYPDLRSKTYVDTGPILERAYAVESGLGWMGKNSMVFVEGIGSYCFLGVALLNLKAEQYGKPLKSKCDRCTKCIQNCPTGALEAPFQHNSNKCLSYLTIEKKGDFNSKEKSLINDHLYGCDTCLDVCPYNHKHAQQTTDERYYCNFEFLDKSISEWEQVSKKEFQKNLSDTVFERLSYKRFQRNLQTVKNNRN